MSVLLTSAAVFAADAHSGQVRKELQEPYIIHPLRVGKLAATLGMPETFIAACYLHDVVEDTKVPQKTIEAIFPESTARLVKVMTKWWESGTDHDVAANKELYYRNLLETENGALLKVLDRIDNIYDFQRMARLSPKNHKWARKYFDKTKSEFGPLLTAVAVHEPQELADTAIRWYTVAMSALEVSL